MDESKKVNMCKDCDNFWSREYHDVIKGYCSEHRENTFGDNTACKDFKEIGRENVCSMKIGKDPKLEIFKLLLSNLTYKDSLLRSIIHGMDCPSCYIPVKYKDLYDHFENGCGNKECDDCVEEFFNILLSKEK